MNVRTKLLVYHKTSALVTFGKKKYTNTLTSPTMPYIPLVAVVAML